MTLVNLLKLIYSHISFAKEIASAHRKNLDLCDVEKREICFVTITWNI